MEKNNLDSPLNLEQLLFRRQFLLGPRRYTPNQFWSHFQLKQDLFLSVHNDLPVTSVSKERFDLFLIGLAIDPNHPHHTEADILDALVTKDLTLKTLIESTWPLGGRWVFILQTKRETFLFTDPSGFRQVFYYSDGKQTWCASQPELIGANCQLRLSTSDTLMNFLLFPQHAIEQSAWVGNKTIYRNCYHLMPNHYLSLPRVTQTRFYPTGSINNKNASEIVETSCTILQGTMEALSNRYGVFSLALTAGWDSRVLLAASKNYKKQIEYFVYQQSFMSKNHPDVWVPSKMAKSLGINFSVRPPGNALPGWFVSMLSKNVTCAPILPKTQNIFDKLTSNGTNIYVNGNVPGVFKNTFNPEGKQDSVEVTTIELADRLFRSKKQPSFVIEELNEWEKGLKESLRGNLHIYDLLYWEQRLSNWGALYPAMQDIAIEEISPFNCRLLIETLLSAPRRLRLAPDYLIYRDMIKHMWPETFSFPINPYTKLIKRNRLMHKIRQLIPPPIVQSIKALRNR